MAYKNTELIKKFNVVRDISGIFFCMDIKNVGTSKRRVKEPTKNITGRSEAG